MKSCIVTTTRVAKLHSEFLSILRKKPGSRIFFIPSGDSCKDLDWVKKAYLFLLNNGFSRNDEIISFGGGAVGDFSGFVASTYMRGVRFIQIPTTLLAMVDSGLGGKTAINFNGVKNLIGTFYKPDKFVVNLDFLNTLSDFDFNSGVAEIIKYGIACDFKLFEFLERHWDSIKNRTVLNKIIKWCIRIKEKITKRDLYDKNIRLSLNFGHTIGHAVESTLNYKVPHGHCVAYGILKESELALAKGLIPAKDYQRIHSLILKFDFLDISFNYPNIEKYINSDKKNRNGKNLFALPTKIGKIKLFSNIPTKQIRDLFYEKSIT